MGKQITVKFEPDGWFSTWINGLNALNINNPEVLTKHTSWYRCLGYRVIYE